MTHPIPERPDFDVRVEPGAERATVHARGEIDLAVSPELLQVVRGELARGPVLLDLEGVRFMDSSGVRALDALTREGERLGTRFEVRPALHPNVRDVLELTGLLAVLPLAGDGDPPAGERR